ncbi:MAG TPA: hypothetical protein VG247_01890 [Pseudonocardiaceae bacterium]|jgi:hypothetical protein|nr:hypothetical protein [Pseudonocardiaceae bacterium]
MRETEEIPRDSPVLAELVEARREVDRGDVVQGVDAVRALLRAQAETV